VVESAPPGGKPQSGFWLYYVLFGAVVVRTFVYSLGENSFAPLPYALMGLFLALSLFEPLLTKKKPVLLQPWLGVQAAIILVLLVSRPLHDYYAMLFMCLCLPVARTLPFGRDLAWFAVFCVLLTAGHLAGFGWPEGILYSPSFIAGVIFIGLYGRANRTAEGARARSEELARQLQEANRHLRVYADQAEETATAQERARLARELHDAVTQTVFSMNLTAQAARLSLEREPRKTPALLDRLQELARDALAETRSMVDELRPHTIAEMGLVNALERHFTLRERRDGLHVSFSTDGVPAGAAAVTDALYRTTQEALNNVVRHSGTMAAAVRLSFTDDRVTLTVRDEGRGFDTGGPRRAESFGLLTMRERVEALGGSFRLSSTPGAGTEIEVRVPTQRGQGDEKQEA
jgi:signal transduction histidine kinase